MIVTIFQGTDCFNLSCSIFEHIIIYCVSLLFFEVCVDVSFSFKILVISVISGSIWQEMQALSSSGASNDSSLSLLLFFSQI